MRVVKDNSVLAERPAETPASSDLIAGSPLSDVAMDVTRAASVTGRMALRSMRQEPLKAIAIAIALGLLIGAVQAATRGRSRQ